jgi:CheY-like chemotaxis protein
MPFRPSWAAQWEEKTLVPHIYHALVVEDDDLSYKLMHTYLRTLPLEITNATTGAEAVEYLKRHMPDLILLDINLPDMHGWEVLDMFKNDPRLNHARIIVLTAHKEPVHRLIGSLQPIAAYMNKPVHQDELLQQVRQLLNL